MSSSQDNRKGILLETGTNEVEFLLLQIGCQRYGINVSKVCQILVHDPEKLAILPKQPPEVVGVMTFRGHSISVIDLRQYLGVEPSNKEPGHDLAIVTEFNQRTIAFIIDSVDRIERCSWDQFEPITDTVCDKQESAVVGTVTLKDGIVIVLDLESIMSSIDEGMRIESYEGDPNQAPVTRSEFSIVYCEDSPLIQKMLLATLQKAGFKNITTFTTGAEGYEYLKNTPADKVDIVLSDIEMPRMDGLSLCKQTKDLPGYQNIPFVFFSSIINEQMEVRCKSVGARACYSKPQTAQLIQALTDIAEKSTR